MKSLFGLSAIVMLLFGVWLIKQDDSQRNTPHQSQSIITVACRTLTRPCMLDNGITLMFDHVPRVMQGFTVKIQSASVQMQDIDFWMQGMAMGLNKYRLITKDNRLWQAQAMLPVCVRGSHAWMIDVRSSEKTYRVEFTISDE